jgi:two-component system chemotaxis response regulator CheB
MIVDDAVVIRKILSDELGTDADIEVAGTASNGKIALQKIPQIQPDVITLDVEMPEMDGLETLLHIKRDYPKIPVIMFSTLTERGGAATIEALSRGASDYVTKPTNVGKVTQAKEAVREDLIRKIKALCGHRSLPVTPTTNPAPSKLFFRPSGAGPILPGTMGRLGDAVVIGVSTGGPNALARVIPALPADLSVPVLIVQHMPPMFTRLLAERLNAQSKFPVVEATEGMKIEPGKVIVAPGDFHLTIAGSRSVPVVVLTKGPPENSCRPAVDVLFRSAVKMYGGELLGVVLTGMGQDGMLGAREIKEAGGTIIAQDKATSVVWGMPGAVVENGLADKILPIESISAEIVRQIKTARKSPVTGARL